MVLTRQPGHGCLFCIYLLQLEQWPLESELLDRAALSLAQPIAKQIATSRIIKYDLRRQQFMIRNPFRVKGCFVTFSVLLSIRLVLPEDPSCNLHSI